jgi:uncharacterized membrane protein
MSKAKSLILYKLCLIIIGTSVLTLGMNLFYIKQFWQKRRADFNLEDILNSNAAPKVRKESQMEKLEKEKKVDVAIVKDKAYWIHHNVLYQADVHSSGEILTDEAKPVDVINMPDNQLSKIIKIVDSFNK